MLLSRKINEKRTVWLERRLKPDEPLTSFLAHNHNINQIFKWFTCSHSSGLCKNCKGELKKLHDCGAIFLVRGRLCGKSGGKTRVLDVPLDEYDKVDFGKFVEDVVD